MLQLVCLIVGVSSVAGLGFPSFPGLPVPEIRILDPESLIRQLEQDAKTAKDTVTDAAGEVIGDAGKILTGVPLAIAQGVSGTGDWLAGILDNSEAEAKTSPEQRNSMLARYNDAVLHKYEDTTLKFPELVKKYGYPVEEYTVNTEDGYILTLFRIPHGKSLPENGVIRPVVFLQHGLVDSSDDWILMGPNKGLGYILADAGYDVWLGNARGNTYSKKHVNRVPSDQCFWEFSWDEIGRFDLPAMIDFSLAKTGQKDLYYVGHSQGTTSFFVMCSMKPEYNAKIRIMFALAPIAWMSNMVSPMIRLVAPGSPALGWALEALGVGEFLPNSQLLAVAGGILCKNRAVTQDICSNSLFLVCGFDVGQLNATMLPVIMGHSPAGSSVKQFLHYAQGLVSKDFRRYDFGYSKNMDVYGSRVPPSYDMSKVTAPVSLFYSTNDWLSHPTDVTTLSQKLGHLVDMHLVSNPNFNHMDYMWAIDGDKLVYSRILKMIKQY